MDNLFDKINSAFEKSPGCIYIGRDQVDKSLPEHHHPRNQMIIVENGVAHLKTRSDTYYVPSRHYVWVPKNIPHTVAFKTKGLILKTLYFTDEHDQGDTFYSKPGIYAINDLLMEMLRFTKDWAGIIRKEDWKFDLLLTMNRLLPHMNTGILKITLPLSENHRLAALLEYMQNNLSEDLQVASVAKKFGYSVRTLNRIFTNELHLSYLKYLKNLRIITAVELLNTSDKNVTETAYLVGYTSLAAFSNTFYEIVKIRPKEFKELKLIRSSDKNLG